MRRRATLALDLEPWLQERARANQRAGARNKASSKLTEAERIDVRKEIATAAGASVGNVTKVKRVLTSAHEEILEALKRGEVSIHRAWTWTELSRRDQQRALLIHRGERGLRGTIRNLISRHRVKQAQCDVDPQRLIHGLSKTSLLELDTIKVRVIPVPGKALFVSEELFKALEPKERPSLCITDSH